MTRAQKVAKAQKLRAKGRTYEQIAQAVGTTKTTARIWLDPAAAERKREESRAWKAQNHERKRETDAAYVADPTTRATCVRCSGPMARSRGAFPGDGLCGDCRHDDVEARDRELEQLWASGKSCLEICKHFGWSKGYLGQEMARARSRGASLPYRYRLTRPRHPALQKAA